MSQIINAPMDLRDRTLVFSKDIVQFCKSEPKNQITQPLINQLIRSATSVGANFVEAKDSASRKDFRNKVLISKKEASEALYWLRIIEDLSDNPALPKLQKECHEIILILQKIINTVGH